MPNPPSEEPLQDINGTKRYLVLVLFQGSPSDFSPVTYFAVARRTSNRTYIILSMQNQGPMPQSFHITKNDIIIIQQLLSIFHINTNTILGQ